ncbi:MAG: phytanoyl-CoA dioxygenase family protein [Planctomycetaceae bacterium]|nr:phytanoyl-CoA dioxygenase family protein [Planctomycetaceae bacterium]
MLSSAEVLQYQTDGFVIRRNLFTPDEVGGLIRFAQQDPDMMARITGRLDAEGNQTKLSLWDDPPHNLFGFFARSRRLVEPATQLLGEEIYHYHSKMMLKEPRTGGAWEWHQDYGYWYNYACLRPAMISCLIALDRADRENGCLQVLPGSQRLGRIDHSKVAGQTGADMERVNVLLEQGPPTYVECQPGDVLFFDCNLLHRSDANRSERSRWSLICCFNARSNSPYKQVRHSSYQPLVVSSDQQMADALAELATNVR